MPNRILKESICTSDSIAALTDFQEAFYYRLIVNCDDFGRMDARPAILKARLYPLRERLTLKEIQSALRALADAGCVEVYEVDGKPYLHLPSWEVHQQIRAKKSKYPSPECGVKASDIICNQVQSNVPVIQSNPNPIRESESEPDAFDVFWAAYPRKVGKGEARKAFGKVKVPLEVLVNALEAQKLSDQWKKDGGRYIPNPATWLNQGRWEDELSSKQEDRTRPAGGAEEFQKELERNRRLLERMRSE